MRCGGHSLMVRKIDWDSQIGRRLKLRDLHVFSTGVQSGSMGEAARQLGASTPAVSEVIANLEHALGVRFWTEAHRASTPRSMAARSSNPVSWWFDELKQSIRDIEFLSDPTVEEVRVACMESLWYTLLPEVILRFSERYPRIECTLNWSVTQGISQGCVRENMIASSSARGFSKSPRSKS